MDKTLLSPLSGFRDYDRPTKVWLSRRLQSLFESFGYQPLETPTIERAELLSKNYGEEAQKLIYLFEDQGGRAVGLRYDLTLSFARYVANNWNELPKPYKRYEIGNVFRGERAQKGRYRQFTQADIDVVGVSANATVLEILSVLANFEELTAVKLVYLVNDRRIINELFDKLGLSSEVRPALLRVLDKKEKLEPAEFSQELRSLDLDEPTLNQLMQIFAGTEPLQELAEQLSSPAVTQMAELIKQAKALKLDIQFTPTMVRGLDYYTGFIIEGVAPENRSLSLVAGGQYDALINELNSSAGVVEAVGISFGVDRFVDYLDERTALVDPTIFVLNYPEIEAELRLWCQELRSSGQRIELFLDAQVEAGRQLKYADKRKYQSVVIPQVKLWPAGKVVLKDMASGKEQTIAKEDVLS